MLRNGRQQIVEAFRRAGYQFGLMGFMSLSSFFRLSLYVTAIHPRYAPRALLVLATSAAARRCGCGRAFARASAFAGRAIDRRRSS